MTTITLRKPTILSTGYLGRGVPSKSIELPAGAEVEYTTRHVDPTCDYLPFLETRHCASAKRGGFDYSTVRSTFALRRAFDPATYYGWAIRSLPTGVWSACTVPGYRADDGFGNLVVTPWEFDSIHRVNEFSTSKMVVDCVEGPVYFF